VETAVGRRRRPHWRLLATVGLPVLGAVVTIGGWWAGTAVFDIRPVFLPSPPDIVEALSRQPAHLLRQAWITLTQTLIGFALAASTSLVLAVALTASRTVNQSVLPQIIAINAVPKVALAPLLVVWLGFGSTPKIVLAFLICFFPILVASMAGLTSTPTELNELARSLVASRWQTFLKIRLPWALPQIFVGLKVGISLAVIGSVVAEMQVPNAGLGAVIVVSGATSDTPLAFAAMTLLAVMSICLFYVVVVAERLLLPWARQITA
jgi:NitT/TauT family transport system permease protein